MDAETELSLEVRDAIASICLNRPERKNAFTRGMLDSWVAALERCATDPGIRVVTITGAGGSFCSGVDLQELSEIGDSPLDRRSFLTEQVHCVARAIDRLQKPLIAAISGVAVGAGLDMALMCDMRIAAKSARMSEGYIRAGGIPGDGGAWLLPRLVGKGKALELLLTGDPVDADEALRIGMVNSVVEDKDLDGATHRLAARIAARPPLAVEMTKLAVRQSEDISFLTSLDIVASHSAVIQSTDDFTEALAALREKRDGNYRRR